jgi:hypothetical protein
MAQVRLEGTHSRIFVLEAGSLDDAALLAFTGSQCHGLALAIQQKTGWPLVAVDDGSGKCVHICTRDPAGRLIDVTGSHSPEEMSRNSGGATREVDRGYLAELQSRHEWVAPDPDSAYSFVEPVLKRAAAEVPLVPLRSSTMQSTRVSEEGIELKIEWGGLPVMDVYVRRATSAAGDWTLYARVGFAPDPDSGTHEIEFTTEHFGVLADDWMRRAYDGAKAEARLRSTG